MRMVPEEVPEVGLESELKKKSSSLPVQERIKFWSQKDGLIKTLSTPLNVTRGWDPKPTGKAQSYRSEGE